MIDAIATDQSYLPLKFSRNKLSHTIEAADTGLTSRVGLRYFLTLSIPEFPFSDNFEELHTSEGRERPVDNQSGLQIYSGAEFRYNSGRNGKIDGLLSYTKPARKQAYMSVSLSQTIAFSLKERVQGGEPAVDTVNELPKMYAIKAGLANEDFYGYGESFFKSWQIGARQFLTWQPNYKRVDAGQEEYLYFLMNFIPKPQQLRLRMQYYYGDGSSSEAVTVMSLSNPLLYSVICCPVGVDPLGIPDDTPDYRPVRYDVWLSNEADKRVSEVRSYLMDHIHEVYDRSILFVNSLGGWDTLRLTGQAQRTLKVSQSVAEIERPANAAVDFSELKVISIEGEYELTISTGYFKRDATAQLKYLDELLLSEEIYLITEKGHRPLQLMTSALLDQADNQDLIARTFGFRILDTVENYSDLPPAQPTAERATTWRGLNLKHVLDSYGKRTGKLVFERLQKVYESDETLVKPYTVKPNNPGDPDYIEPIVDSSIIVGSTPYPNVLISRPGSFLRTNCAPGLLGGPATITIAAGTYGGEKPADADALAEAKYNGLNTQAYANSNGTCTVNNVPVHFGIFHKIPMDIDSLVMDGSGDHGPVVDLRVNEVEFISNTTGHLVPSNRISDNTTAPGTYNLLCRVNYSTLPFRSCKLRIASKSREITVTDSGYYLFENVVVNSSDEPLTVEVVNI